MLKKVAKAAPWLLLLLLAAVNLSLLRQNRQMRGALANARPAETERLQEGTPMPPFAGTNLAGETVQISYGPNAPRRALLFFTPTCPYCRQQFAYWKELLKVAQSKHLEVFGLVDSREDKTRLESYLQEMECDAKARFPLQVLLVTPEVKRQYKLQSTPNTILVKADGSVEKEWLGLWQADEIASAATSLELRLTAPWFS